jgi:hypothetical protein
VLCGWTWLSPTIKTLLLVAVKEGGSGGCVITGKVAETVRDRLTDCRPVEAGRIAKISFATGVDESVVLGGLDPVIAESDLGALEVERSTAVGFPLARLAPLPGSWPRAGTPDLATFVPVSECISCVTIVLVPALCRLVMGR